MNIAGTHPKSGFPCSHVLCANPNCQYLVDEDASIGGYCCRNCHWRHSSGSKGGKKHESSCKKRAPPPGAVRALPTPPKLAYAPDGSRASSTLSALCDKSMRASLACANPNCLYLVAEDLDLGGYCCRNCHYRHVTGAKPQNKHDPDCPKCEAPDHVLRAPPHAPEKPHVGTRARGDDDDATQPSDDELDRSELACAGNCGFYVAKDPSMGGYCCEKCHHRHSTGKKAQRSSKNHTSNCERREAPDGARMARALPPARLWADFDRQWWPR